MVWSLCKGGVECRWFGIVFHYFYWTHKQLELELFRLLFQHLIPHTMGFISIGVNNFTIKLIVSLVLESIGSWFKNMGIRAGNRSR